jgi:hypothetical protein
MDCSDKLMNIILNDITSLPQLIEWGEGNRLTQDPLYQKHLHFLRGIDTKVRSLNVTQDVEEWAFASNLIHHPIVQRRLNLLHEKNKILSPEVKRKIASIKTSEEIDRFAEVNHMEHHPYLEKARHLITVQRVKCDVCCKTFSAKLGLKNHKCDGKINCRKCGQKFTNRKEFYHHFMSLHQSGGSDTNPIPFDSMPWGNEDDQDLDLRKIYEMHQSFILDTHQIGPITSIYNFPLGHTFDVDTLMKQASEIYDMENKSFKLNLTFGIILQNRETKEYRYFKPHKNNEVFQRPIYVTNRNDMKKLEQKLKELDVNQYVLNQRPNSKYIPTLVTNVKWWISHTNYPLGLGMLPEYIRNMKSIIGLDTDRRGLSYEDDNCIFRCLTFHRNPQLHRTHPNEFEASVQAIRMEYTSDFGPQTFELLDLPDFERLFQINVNIFSIDPDYIAFPVYKSMGQFPETMHLNLFENHLSYIKNISSYCQKWQCTKCDRLFDRSDKLKKHFKNCESTTKFVFPGGFYSSPKTVFEELEEVNVFVDHPQRTYPWFIVFDFEAMLKKTPIKSSDKQQWTHQHVPISVSICSNIDEFRDPICYVNPDMDVLLQSMIQTMTEMSLQANSFARRKWGYVFDELEHEKRKWENLPKRSKMGDDADPDQDVNSKMCRKLDYLLQKFGKYCKQVPVLGYNSARYDLNLVKERLACHLEMNEDAFVIKRNNSYLCMSQPLLKFLDITSYLSPGFSYAQFLIAYEAEATKSFFPYEWFDCVEKLDQEQLPEYEAFFSTLKGKNLLEEDGCGRENYENLKTIWQERGMKTMRDFLVFYNNQDVGPFVKAVENLQKFYFDKHIDLFKTSVSLPGIARTMLFETAKRSQACFSLFDEDNKDLYETMKTNIVGGPSIVFTRYHKAGETRIRGKKKCRSIVGLDANALYLWAFGEPMPTGPFVRRIGPHFTPRTRDKHLMMYHWMDWVSQNSGVKIIHKMNNGKEKVVGPFRVDGYDPHQNKIYEFLGCYFHGHHCQSKDPEREKKFNHTQRRLGFLTEMGHQVETIWECEFEKKIKSQLQLREFIAKRRPPFTRTHPRSVNEKEILEGVLSGELFGAVEVDIAVPDHLYEHFSECSPIFCNTNVPFEKMGSHMQEHVKKFKLSEKPRRLLVGGMRANKILLASSLLKWYIEHGLEVTKVYQVVEFTPSKCFENFVEQVTEARRRGDIDPTQSVFRDTMKLLGNSAFGSSIMNKEKHQKVSYVKGENMACLKVNEPEFKKLTSLEHDMYEVESYKKKIVLNVPTQIGFFILQYAKLRMLSFHYDCIDTILDRSNYQLMETDTDSYYYALSDLSIESLVEPQHKEAYLLDVYHNCDGEVNADRHWFPRKCCQRHSKHDARTPGLFKLEYQGDEMVALCSKTYIINQSPDSFKLSCKGINKRNIVDPFDHYKSVLDTQVGRAKENVGFGLRNNSVFTYTQNRLGFTYFYCKREVLEDGISTVPLDLLLVPKQ